MSNISFLNVIVLYGFGDQILLTFIVIQLEVVSVKKGECTFFIFYREFIYYIDLESYIFCFLFFL